MCKFYGLDTENPYGHIRLFLNIVDNIRADGATRDVSRLCFFHFTLKWEAKKWLERLQPIHATSWEQLSSHYLNKFFPPKRTAFNRSQILQFCQDKDEPIRDAWRRFQDLLRKTPHHGVKKWLLAQLFYDNMIPEDKGKFSQIVNFKFASLHEDDGWDRIEEFVQHQEDPWDDPLPHEYVLLAFELTKPTMDDWLKRPHQQLTYLITPTREKSLKTHISSVIFVNNDIPPWGNYIKEEGEEDLHWVLRSKFKDDMANFIMEKKHHLNGLREMMDQQKTNMHEQFSKVFTTLRRNTSLNDPPMAITTLSGTTTRDSPHPASHTFPLPHEQASNDEIGSKEPLKQEKKDEDEKLLNIFKQIHINLPFLEAMIHIPKGAKVLKDLLSHKEKLEKAASSVKLSEECSAVIQKGLPPKEGDPRSFILPCLIGPLAVKKCFGKPWSKHQPHAILPFLQTGNI
ncbi:reverse transcriptase domain-containing protein [Tanacetum coccineum]